MNGLTCLGWYIKFFFLKCDSAILYNSYKQLYKSKTKRNNLRWSIVESGGGYP